MRNEASLTDCANTHRFVVHSAHHPIHRGVALLHFALVAVQGGHRKCPTPRGLVTCPFRRARALRQGQSPTGVTGRSPDSSAATKGTVDVGRISWTGLGRSRQRQGLGTREPGPRTDDSNLVVINHELFFSPWTRPDDASSNIQNKSA